MGFLPEDAAQRDLVQRTLGDECHYVLEPDQILERLPMFWAADLKAALEVTGERVVLFLDTYEALWEGQRVEQRRFTEDEWVREWILHLPEALWVMTGREKVAWEEVNPAWGKVLEQHLIGKLADADARRFLDKAGVTGEATAEAIIQGAEGVPFYLDLAVDTYAQIRQTGGTPTAADFARTPREVIDRFLSYLSLEERETLNVLSAARTWDRTLFEGLIEAFRTGYPPTALRALTRFSFIEEVAVEDEVAEPTWTMHPLMRRGLQEHGDPALIDRVHRHLFEQYGAALSEINPKAIEEQERRALEEAFYHARQVLEPEALVEWYREAEDPFQQGAQWRLLIPLQEQMLAVVEENCGPEDEQAATALHNLADL